MSPMAAPDDFSSVFSRKSPLLMQAENLGVPLVFFLHFVVVHHLLAQLPQLLLGLFQLLPGFFGAAKLAEKAADPVRNAGHGGLERGDDGAGDGGWYGGQPPGRRAVNHHAHQYQGDNAQHLKGEAFQKILHGSLPVFG